MLKVKNTFQKRKNNKLKQNAGRALEDLKKTRGWQK